MKGVSYLTDSKNRKKAVVINLKTLVAHKGALEDFLDVIIADSRQNEPETEWKEVKKNLKKKGKI